MTSCSWSSSSSLSLSSLSSSPSQYNILNLQFHNSHPHCHRYYSISYGANRAFHWSLTNKASLLLLSGLKLTHDSRCVKVGGHFDGRVSEKTSLLSLSLSLSLSQSDPSLSVGVHLRICGNASNLRKQLFKFVSSFFVVPLHGGGGWGVQRGFDSRRGLIQDRVKMHVEFGYSSKEIRFQSFLKNTSFLIWWS